MISGSRMQAAHRRTPSRPLHLWPQPAQPSLDLSFCGFQFELIWAFEKEAQSHKVSQKPGQTTTSWFSWIKTWKHLRLPANPNITRKREQLLRFEVKLKSIWGYLSLLKTRLKAIKSRRNWGKPQPRVFFAFWSEKHLSLGSNANNAKRRGQFTRF